MQIDRDYLLRMCDSLDWFYREAGKLIDGYQSKPAAGSQAARESSTYPREESLVTVWGIGLQLIEFGGDHLSAFVKTVTEPAEVIACWTCIRSMLESCAISCWLLDPSIDVQTRVGRAYAHRYEGLVQQLKFGRCAGVSMADISAAEQHIVKVEQDAISLGFTQLKDRNGRRNGIGVLGLSATDVIKKELDEEKMYRLLSGIAHGHWWAIHGLGFVPSKTAQQVNVGDISAIRFEKQANANGIALLGCCGTKALIRPLWHCCRYFGWDEMKFEELFENVADRLQLNVGPRFWRNYNISTPVFPQT
jgi:hypothetical protein